MKELRLAPFRPSAGRPLIMGHRGVRRDGVVENTMPAFEAAALDGANAIELDVRVCRTGEVVVAHDPTLRRITEGRDPRAIADLPLCELSQVELPFGARVPTLVEVLGFARGRHLLVNIEMKRDAPSRAAIVRGVAGLLHAWDPAHGILVSSFDPGMLSALRAQAPHVPCALLVHQSRLHRVAVAVAGPIGASAVHLERVLTRPERVRSLRARGMIVNVWTVNDPKEARELCAIGVDGLITDDPATIAAAIS